MTQKGNLANQIFKKMKITETELKKQLLDAPQKKNQKISPALSPESKKLIKKSSIISNNFDHNFIGTEHLLSAFLQADHPKINKLLKNSGADPLKIDEQITLTLKTISKFSGPVKSLKPALSSLEEFDFFPEEAASEMDFITEITEKNQVEKFDPVIARNEEIERIIQILCRRKKNNPLLIGEPGVGKTAIVEGLAKKIAALDVPYPLFGKKIFKLDLGGAIAGTMFRGEFESRLKKAVSEIQNDPNAILFIDEIHNLVGAGASSGSLDAANILKPALSRGEFSLIGATTYADYKKFIERDQALIRRFEKVKIEEPSAEKSVKILSKLKTYYEDFHRITISDAAIETAVLVSSRYINDKFLPDKAIDLIDEAASDLKIKKQKHNLGFIQIELEKKLKKIKDEKRKYISGENFGAAIELRKKESDLKKELDIFKKFKEQVKQTILGEIASEDILRAASRMTNIPIEKLDLNDKKNILGIEKKLKSRIIGQDSAIKIVTKYLKRSLLNMTHPDRPLGSFLFLGPTGVGKTELAKVIAETVFGNKKSLIKLDMSEFSDKFNTSRLVGAPAGYVGYEEGGKLTEFIKRNPYSLVLFDEIEKAHPEVFNLLLQILEDGILTDARGETINFKNTLIILTSNIGLKDFYNKDDIGFGSGKKSAFDFDEIKNSIDKDLRKSMRPELLGRLDKILFFNPLQKNDIEKIVKIQLKELNDRLFEKNIKLKTDGEALRHLSDLSFSPNEGARAVRKIIQEKIEDEIIEVMLKNKKDGKIQVGRGEIIIEKV